MEALHGVLFLFESEFETKLLLRRIDGAIQVRSNVDLTFYSLVGPGRYKFGLNGKMEHLTTHLHRPRTTRSPLSFWGDGGIVLFEPFFHAFLGGLEKAAINRISLILPSRKEEGETLFPFRGD
ncbi:hypothetical protein LUZ63_019974 [Rhynchospora breviuscula]|uniref:Uncharacterized protein ycf68 n=1 Tax=Rhynchospora breviuscula TaxID=2022672 RepID=A0A9Q0C7B0_9POAL|nr:hypothetical protein LUZ63_019974 [Rhynchospora breviuscula]